MSVRFAIFFPARYNKAMLQSRRRSLSSSKVFIWSKISSIILFGTIGLVLVTVFLFIWYGKDLPAPGKLIDVQQSQSTRIYDRNGILLYSVYKDTNRVYVKLPNIPKYLQEATVATEDKNFYTNGSFPIMGYLRAFRDILLFRGVTGGSGIPQQLVRNTLISNERTITRKIKELILSIQINKVYTKDQILEMYLNDVPYGGNNSGVEAAAETYFGKHVNELDLAECAFLAGLPQSPTTYSPFSGNKYYIDRTQGVLSSMVAGNYITQKQADDALAEIKAYNFSQQDTSIKAPHFVMYVKNLAVKQFGEDRVQNGGLQIYTTLDYNIQKQAEQIVSSELDKIKNYNVTNGAAMVEDPRTGEILAMVGSKDYFDTANDGNFNVATMAQRQPGSSMKPIAYAVAFQKGYTPASMFMDVKTDFTTGQPGEPDYIPVNYDQKDHGPMQLRFALGNSDNVIAVKLLAKIGIKDVMQQAYDMGVTSWEPTPQNMQDVGLSLVLGGRYVHMIDEMTAYGVFATGGYKYDPVAITSVKDGNGNTIYTAPHQQGTKVLGADVAFLISHILSDNNARAAEFGLNSYLVVPGRTVAVKTGTTDDKRDNWAYGYTPSYVVGVWVGNNDNSPMNQAIASGETGASPIWQKLMMAVLKGKPSEDFKVPDNVTALMVDSVGGGLPSDGKPTRSEYFIKGTEPTAPSAIYQKLKLSNHQQGKLANADEISHGDFSTKDFIVYQESDPVSTDGKNRWQDGINDWIHKTYSAANPEYFPPTETSDYKY